MFRSQKVTQGLPYSFAVGIILFQKILLALIDLSAASFSKGLFNDFQNLIFLIESGCILPWSRVLPYAESCKFPASFFGNYPVHYG